MGAFIMVTGIDTVSPTNYIIFTTTSVMEPTNTNDSDLPACVNKVLHILLLNEHCLKA